MASGRGLAGRRCRMVKYCHCMTVSGVAGLARATWHV
jgi:hypothetical protein